MSKRERLGLVAIRTEGAILPPSVLQRIHVVDEKLGGLKPEDFGLSGTRVREAASQAWNALQGPWLAFSTKRAQRGEGDTTFALSGEWVRQVLRALDYGNVEVSGRALHVGPDDKYRASAILCGHVPLYVVGHGLLLDRRPSAGLMTPHGNIQLFLNSTDENLWGFVTNGLQWRILRDSVSLSRQAMVEIDLEAIFDGGLYDEFLLFFLLCHESRLRAERPADCWLERWSQTASEEGKRALDTLRDGVQDAIEALGQGFLRHPGNVRLRQRLRSGELDKQDYYRQVLRLVYRLLFLFVAEDRDLLASPKATDSQRRLFQEAYSTQRLRLLAERIPGAARHHDLFIGLKLVLAALGDSKGLPELGLAPLGGLFSRVQTEDLDASEISNRDLLNAIRCLAVTREGGRRTRVDYKNLGSEELGSVYESLLELHPDLDPEAAKFELKSASGNERKTTGSYYTPDSLIQCLLDTALDPVVHEAVRTAKTKFAPKDGESPEAQAILDLKVIDPAVGSGHFLIAASHRLAKRLAQVRTGDEEPSPVAVRRALRDVIGRCLYGIDLNPMSAELCKVALWLEAMEPGRPLAFLDHHIQVGNSLLGTTPELIAQGIPDGAFDPLEGDDRDLCKDLKKLNKAERAGQSSLFSSDAFAGTDLLKIWHTLESLPDETLEDVRQKEMTFQSAESGFAMRRLLADAWCTAFVMVKKPAGPNDPASGSAITSATLRRIANGSALDEGTTLAIKEARKRFGFLHPHLAFPEVFAKGGFDVVLGNPPWERVKLQEKEFFAERSPEIATAKNKAERDRLIKGLKGTHLHAEFVQAQRDAESASVLLRKSGRYPLTGRGDVNTYTVFSELMRNLLNEGGHAGVIVPSGIATDDTTKLFFADLIGKQALSSLFDFENGMRVEVDQEESSTTDTKKKKKSKGSSDRLLFASVHSRYKFALVTMTGTRVQPREPKFAFFCHRTSDLLLPDKVFTLTPEDIELLNPNTKTCPVFRTRRDAEITKAIYRRVPVLIREGAEDGNPWGISFQRMFDMSTDSHLFRTHAELERAGGILDGNEWHVPQSAVVDGREIASGKWLPLYEAKMIHHYDHRWATYETVTVAKGKKEVGDLEARDTTLPEKQNPNFVVQPRYWVTEGDFVSAVPSNSSYFLGFRDICRSTDVRTSIFSLVPRCGIGNTMPILKTVLPVALRANLLANLTSFALDYVSRQKIGGTHLTYSFLNQFPVLRPSIYAEPCSWDGTSVSSWLLPRILELAFTSIDIVPFSSEIGFAGAPFTWNSNRREQLRAELDAAFFHLYGLPREDVDYIMDTFHVVRNNDIQTHGTYRTKEAILEAYDAMAEAIATGGTYQSPLNPPPANGWTPPSNLAATQPQLAAHAATAATPTPPTTETPFELVAPEPPQPKLDLTSPQSQPVVNLRVNGKPAIFIRDRAVGKVCHLTVRLLEDNHEVTYQVPPAKVEFEISPGIFKPAVWSALE